jgi:hypothetical protein
MADRLVIKEKHTVQKLLNQEKTIKEISDVIGKSEHCIEKYVENELLPLLVRLNGEGVAMPKIVTAIQAAEEAKADYEDEVKTDSGFLSPEVTEEAVKMLVLQGIPDGAARSCIINQVVPELTSHITDATVLYKICLNRLNIHMTLQKTTAGGNQGVTISNQGASAVMDAAREKHTVNSDSAPQHIFKPQG